MKRHLLWVLSPALLSSVFVFSPAVELPQDDNGGAGLLQGGPGRPPWSGISRTLLTGAPQRVHLPPGSLPQGIRRRVPQDYATIQAAINVSSDGDTVLISEGTYYENIRYRGRAIVVGSLYVVDGDTTHIPATIIDGSSPAHADSGSVVSFIEGEDTTSVLCGLTIRGGSGTVDQWAGYPLRVGGGVRLDESGARIMKNIIARNRVYSENSYGGGICAHSVPSVVPVVIIENNHITDNYVEGLGSTVNSEGGGVSLIGVVPRMLSNIVERDTVVAVSQANGGGAFMWGHDTDHPAPPHPGGIFGGNTFRANVARTHTYGVTGIGLGLAWTGDVAVTGNLFEGNTGTSVSGWAEGGGVIAWDGGVTGYGRKLITGNRFLGNQLSHGGTSTKGGGALDIDNTLATVDGNEIAGNSADGAGGGINIYRSSFRLQNNLISGNRTTTSGGGVAVGYSPNVGTEEVIINNTFAGNAAGQYGGGACVSGAGADVVMLNNIFWTDSALHYSEIYAPGTFARVIYCNVEGGHPGTGNIAADPQFISGSFDLAGSSPCIGAGRDTLVTLPGTDYHGTPRPLPGGSHPDIGACESPRAVPLRTLLRVPLDYSTLQAAIDAALPGDTVLADDGTYRENVLINKSSILVASRYILDTNTQHIDATVIDGSTPRHPDSGATVTMGVLADTTTVLAGFTITGGTGNRDTYAPYPWPGFIRQGGGVAIEARGKVHHNRITGNSILAASDEVGAYAAGIGLSSFSNSCAIIEDNRITRNVIRNTRVDDIDVAGAGMLIGGNGRILRNVVAEDTIICSSYGGATGIYIGDCTGALVADNTIEHNYFQSSGGASSYVTGGGISCRRGTVTITGNTIHGNILSSSTGAQLRGGGIDIRNSSDTVTVILRNNRIDSNAVLSAGGSGAYGGGVCVYRTKVILENNAITSNAGGFGGGLFFSEPTAGRRPALINNTIAANAAEITGGGIYNGSGADPLLINSIVCGNTAYLSPSIYGACTVVYSDIDGGYPGAGNIDAPPQFSPGGFSLSETSPCLGTGIDSVFIGGTWYTAPDHCMMGSLRPSPAWSMPDMGACESGLASPLARMFCSPESVNGGALPADSTVVPLTIFNFGGTPLTWTITTPGDPAWMSVSPASGSTPAGGSTAVNVTLRAVQPAGSVQTASLVIGSNDTVSGPRTLPVRLSVLLTLGVGFEPAWNILSTPVRVPDPRTGILFPTATAGAFRYVCGSGYVPADSLEAGRGYWLKFPAAGSSVMTGFALAADTVEVQRGWNIIGSISAPVGVGTIGSIPGGIITSQFIGYGPAGYAPASSIEPGRGYWVKTNQAGALVLGAPGLGCIRILPTRDQPPAAPGEGLAETPAEVPAETALGQNYPNPFNPLTTIRYSVADAVGTRHSVSLRVYDLLGREVATLVNEAKDPGLYTVIFDGTHLASGMYLYRLTAGRFTETRQMMLVK